MVFEIVEPNKRTGTGRVKNLRVIQTVGRYRRGGRWLESHDLIAELLGWEWMVEK